MFGSFKYLGGDFPKFSTAQFTSDTFIINGMKNSYRKNDVESVQQVTDQNKKTVLGTAGWGAGGLLLLGPLGAIGGMLIGGNSKKITFAVKFNDGKKLLGECDPKVWAKIMSVHF